jgi:hypothetical protein
MHKVTFALFTQLTLSLTLSLGACAVDIGDDPDGSTLEAAVTTSFAANPTRYAVGYLDAQDGWTSTGCTVFPSDGVYPGNWIKCGGAAGGSKGAVATSGGTHTLLLDSAVNDVVENATLGKWSLEGPQGRVFQVIQGCGNVRLAFQMSGPTLPLASYPCTPNDGNVPPWFRVICTWQTGGTSITCGASADLSVDPVPTMTLSVPTPIRPFNGVSLSTFDLPGAMKVGKQYLWTN